MDPDALRLALDDAAEDSAAQEARREVCSCLALSFERLGTLLHVDGHFFGPQRVDGSSPFGNGDDRIVALGYLARTAGALVGGAVDLAVRGNCYASAALNRQLVEVEYLAWAFAEDREEATTWLRASPEDRRARWQPRHLRDRSAGRFRGKDYANHCEVGGHPTPPGMRQLLAGDLVVTEFMIRETAAHGMSTWDYLLLGVAAHARDGTLDVALMPQDLFTTVHDAAARWRTADRLGPLWSDRRHEP